MPAYGNQVPPEDRWAIVLYVRALQRGQAATVNDLSEQERASLR
jgi:mono/diheme cytochrome c family protein